MKTVRYKLSNELLRETHKDYENDTGRQEDSSEQNPGGGEATNFRGDGDSSEEDDPFATSREKHYRVFQTESTKTGQSHQSAKDKHLHIHQSHAYEEVEVPNPPVPPPRSSSSSELHPQQHTAASTTNSSQQELQSKSIILLPTILANQTTCIHNIISTVCKHVYK